MSLIQSLLAAIVRLNGESLVLHVGEKPYVLTSTAALNAFRGPLEWGQVELSTRTLTAQAVTSMLDQLLTEEQRRTLDEVGAVDRELHPGGDLPAFTVIAARGGDDIWLEIRPVKDKPEAEAAARSVSAEEPAPAVEESRAPAQDEHAVPAGVHHIEDAADATFEIVPDVEQEQPEEHEVTELLAAAGLLEADAGITVASRTEDGADEVVEWAPDEERTEEADEDEGGSPRIPAELTTASEETAVIAAGVSVPASEPAPSEPGIVELGVLAPPPEPPLEAPHALHSEISEMPIVEPLDRAVDPGTAPEIELAADVPESAPAVEAVAAGARPDAVAESGAADAVAPAIEPPLALPEPHVVLQPEPQVLAEVHPPDVHRPEEEEAIVPSHEEDLHIPVTGIPAVDVAPARSALAEPPAGERAAMAPPVESAGPGAPDAPAPAIAPEPMPAIASPAQAGVERTVPDQALDLTPMAAAAAPPADVPAGGTLRPEPAAPAAVPPEDRVDRTRIETRLPAADEEFARPAVVLPMSRPPREAASALSPPVTPVSAPNLDRLLRIAAARGASGLYLVAQSHPVVRVDGEMQPLEGEEPVTAADVEAFTFALAPEPSREAVRSGATSEWFRDVPDLGRVRCLAFRDHRGPGFIVRMLPARAISVEQLGLSKEIQALCAQPDGLVLVAGPRASGTSTLISAFVDLINRSRADHVITIERQISFVHESRRSFVSQREVRGDADELAVAVRTALREDPDVLVVEELRSADIIAAAVEAADSGRFVLAGLRAPATVPALERLVEQFPAERRPRILTSLSTALRGVVGQVLLRKRGGGRIAARELLLNTPAAAALIADGKLFQLPAALESGRKVGSVALNDALAALIRDGIVDAGEAWRKAYDREGLLTALKREGIDTSFVERLA